MTRRRRFAKLQLKVRDHTNDPEDDRRLNARLFDQGWADYQIYDGMDGISTPYIEGWLAAEAAFHARLKAIRRNDSAEVEAVFLARRKGGQS